MVWINGGYVETEHPQRGRDLAADEAEPDHDRPPAWPGQLLDALRIVDRAQVEDAIQVRACEWKPALATASGDKEPVIFQVDTIVEPNPVSLRIDIDRPSAEYELDALALVVVTRRNKRLLESLLAAEEPFREWWPVVGQVRLRADKREPAVEPEAAQLERSASAGQSATNHDNHVIGHISY